jgi:hypothetical protein
LALIHSALEETWYGLLCGKETPDIRDARRYLIVSRLWSSHRLIVVLNSIKVNKDLLEKRPDIYSDRPVIPIFDMYVSLS